MGLTADLLPNEKSEVGRLDTRRSSSHVRDGLLETIRATEEKSGLEDPSILTALPSGPRPRSPGDWAPRVLYAEEDEIVSQYCPAGWESGV